MCVNTVSRHFRRRRFITVVRFFAVTRRRRRRRRRTFYPAASAACTYIFTEGKVFFIIIKLPPVYTYVSLKRVLRRPPVLESSAKVTALIIKTVPP